MTAIEKTTGAALSRILADAITTVINGKNNNIAKRLLGPRLRGDGAADRLRLLPLGIT
jgi:hypothetical protein